MQHLPATGRRESGRGATGFTLIEIAVILFVMALMALLIMPSIRGFHLSRLKEATRQLAGRATFLYDQASADKLVLRLTFNLDTNSYSVSRLDPHSINPMFVPDLQPGATPVRLPPDVKLRDVTVEGIGTVTKGTASCIFYPEGYVDATVVHLIDSRGTVFTVSFQPLTGRVTIAKGDLAPAAVQANS